MKALILSLSLLFSTNAYAEYCATLDYSVKAKINEVYIDVILIRTLHELEINGEMIYDNWFGKVDFGETFYLGKSRYAINMFSLGMTVEDRITGEVYEMICQAPKNKPAEDSPEYKEMLLDWEYTFGDKK